MNIRKIIKVLAVIVFITLLILMKIMNIFDVSNVHEFDKISFEKGSFEEIVLNEYYSEAKGNEFGIVFVHPFFNRDDDRDFKSQAPELIEDILVKLNKMQLESYDREVINNITCIFNEDYQSYDVRDKKDDIVYYNSYVIRFSIPGTSEDLSIYINKNDSEYILVKSDILNTWEEKNEKIIHHEIESLEKIYKVNENQLDMEFIDMLLDLSDDNGEPN
ncbi:hypothetical protein SAMN02745751_00110 [Dethiosulfatibacter aminovorans DSM 17477]|uniref:Uncharacterized protein n=1 Tax=Dethiosulfatibacter aminovorans DSM 17477 TaxID=1121476 RepID=A0A1M6AG76_9FIRM|nr:hypothetical protein [Dethiosulfatibacter aminovorans]SHI35479.1 hypothetical protein SAMN02745751_00110 [Dethiosulfatibacter aminovorans DSM 17477]